MPTADRAYSTRPISLPLPKRLPRATREKVEAAIESLSAARDALIAYLDRMDGDADFEPSLGARNEPAAATFAPWAPRSQAGWAAGGQADLEQDDSDFEPDSDDEPSLVPAQGIGPEGACYAQDLEIAEVRAG